MSKKRRRKKKRSKKILWAAAIVIIAAAVLVAVSIDRTDQDQNFDLEVLNDITDGIADSISAITDPGEDETVTYVSAENAAGALDISQIEIPEYSGSPTATINNNEPFFEDDELTTEYYILLSDLDELGRCGSNVMCADEEDMATGERDSISDIHPTAWHGGGFYNRSHLLMWKLSGCDDERNLITGTVTFNQETMLEYEEQVTAYLWANEENHVMYRVTPLFDGENLLADGVLMEAYSVEDGGSLSFCVFCYNVEPGAEIDYATGDYTE